MGFGNNLHFLTKIQNMKTCANHGFPCFCRR